MLFFLLILLVKCIDIINMDQEIIKKFKPFLWSYDISKVDLNKNKERIITNVLNLGTKEATDLIFYLYKKMI